MCLQYTDYEVITFDFLNSKQSSHYISVKVLFLAFTKFEIDHLILLHGSQFFAIKYFSPFCSKVTELQLIFFNTTEYLILIE